MVPLNALVDKRPYRIPVQFFNKQTGKSVSFNTRDAWFRFIYFLDYFPEPEVVDPKMQQIHTYTRVDAALRYKRN